MTLQELRTTIRSYIRMQECSGLCNPNDLEHLANSLTFFIRDVTKKYIAGQKEHGGNLRDRNLRAEAYNEFLDMFVYNSAQMWDDALLGGIDEFIKKH